MNVETLRELLREYGLTLHSIQLLKRPRTISDHWHLRVEDKQITVIIYSYSAERMLLLDILLDAVLEEFTK